MKKILALLTLMFLLSACASPMALLGPAAGATNGKLVQSSVKSAISLGVKQKTGKNPLEHILAYTEKNNPNKKKEQCVSFIKKTNSEACTIINKQIALAQTTVRKKMFTTQNVVKEKAQVVLEKNLEIKNKSNNLIKFKKSPKEFVLAIQKKIKEYDDKWIEKRKNRSTKYLNQ